MQPSTCDLQPVTKSSSREKLPSKSTYAQLSGVCVQTRLNGLFDDVMRRTMDFLFGACFSCVNSVLPPRTDLGVQHLPPTKCLYLGFSVALALGQQHVGPLPDLLRL
jgi:hypothetical protein